MNDTDELQERVKLLEIGRKYTWRELLNILNLQLPKKGKGRLDLIAKIKRYCNYERIGHSYIVTEIFDDPVPKIHAAKYSNHAIVILLRELLLLNRSTYRNTYSKIEKTIIGNYNLFELLGLCNRTIFDNEFDRLRRIQNKYPGTIITPEEIEAHCSFSARNIGEMYEVVRNIRKTLTNRKYLYWDKVFYVKTLGQAPDEKPREATSDEIGWIIEAQRLALKKMGLESEFQVMNCWQQVNGKLKITNRWQEYERITLAKLKGIQIIIMESEQIVEFEKVNRIIFNRAGVEAGLQLYSGKCSAELAIEMNNLMLDKIIKDYSRLFTWDATFKNEREDSIAKGVIGPFSYRKPEDVVNIKDITIAENTIEYQIKLPESTRKIFIPVTSMTEKELLS